MSGQISHYSIHMLLLPEGQRGEVWETSIKKLSFGNQGAPDRKVLSLSSFTGLCTEFRNLTFRQIM